MILQELLRDHVIDGQPMLPGAVAIELMVAAARKGRGCLEAITFHRPAVLSRADALDLLLEIEGDAVRLVDPAHRRPYCDARFGELVPTTPAVEFAPIDATRFETLDRDRIYEWFASLGISYGPWFRTLQDVRRDGRRIKARLTAKGGDGFVLHPSLLDGALQAIGCAAFGRSGGLFVPYAIERLVWYGPLGTDVEVDAHLESSSDDLLRGEACLSNARGQTVAVLSGVSIKRVSAAARPPTNQVLHHAVWIPAPAVEVPTPSRSWRWCGDNDPAPPMEDEPADLLYSAGSGEESVADFIRWARGVRADRVAVVAALGAPASEAVLGAARALRLERPALHVRAIAVAPGTTRARVLAELDCDEPEIVLDGEARFIRAIRPLQTLERPFPLPSGAAVVVTGGFGGIGLAVARWLFDRCGARLLLVGRRGLAEGSPAHDAVRLLRSRGADVMTAAADVTDRTALAHILRDARATFGPIQAVFHAAGIVRDSLLGRKTDADVRLVLAPKIRGTQVLDELTADDPLVCFVLFSSIASYTGNVGQTDYAAANRFLDAYARKRQSEGRPFQSIAFGPWAEIGMAAPLVALARKNGIEPLSPALALDALERALSTRFAEIVVTHVTSPLTQAGLVVASEASEPARPAPSAALRSATVPALPAGSPARSEELERILVTEVARFLEVEAEQLDVDSDLAEYGVDSILAAQLLREVERTLDRRLDPALLFEARTIKALAARLSELTDSTHRADELADPAGAVAQPLVTPDALVAQADRAPAPAPSRDAIAVIGFAARLPGASDLDTFFDGLMTGRSFVREIPRERFDIDRYHDSTGERPGTTRSRWAALLDNIDWFDPLFYGISPREAALIDPQQRLLLDVAWETLEHAGYGPRLAGSRTGVFVAGTQGEYGQRFLGRPEMIDGHTAVGNSPSILANRLSHAFDFRGPSFTLDTACSSSLVALHLARHSLLRGESTLALVAGVNVLLRPETFIAFSRAQLLSPTGGSRPFSPDADGYVRAEAAVALLLKPLDRAIADHDTIHAVLLGSAVTQDGRTSGLTTPDLRAEIEVMTGALGGVEASSLDYIEAHAVGSRLGDALELEAIGRVGARCPIGSIKGNVGHAEVASGLVSVIKVLLGFAGGVMPPTVADGQRSTADARILSRPAALRPASRVLVNAFGFGGTNASVVLERRAVSDTPVETAGEHLLLLSARSEPAFAVTAARLRETIETSRHDVADICFTQSTGRRFETFRAAAVGDRSALRSGLADLVPTKVGRRPKIAFLFTGQGSQYAGMGRLLFEHLPAFRAAIERCERILESHLDTRLRDILFNPDPGGRINETLNTQPALFALEWSLVETWKAAGVEPHAVLGHSVGELVAATVAGAMTLDEGLRFTVDRARALQRLPRGGGMAVLMAPADRVRALIDQWRARCSIAAINGPENVAIAGDAQALESILARATELGIMGRRLAVSHAFHSALVEPALAEIERAASAIDFQPLRIGLASNLFGRLLEAGDRLDAVYWRRHAREPVRFLDGIRALDADVCLEIGPDAVLTSMARTVLGASDKQWVTSLRRGQVETRTMLEAAKTLFVAGADLDVGVLSPGRHRVPIPSSVREPRRIWFEDVATPPATRAAPSSPAPAVFRDVLREEAARVLKLDLAELSTKTPLRSVGLDSLLAIELSARMEGRLGQKLSFGGVQENASIDDLVAEFGTSRPSTPPVAPVDPDPTRGLDLEAYARYARPAMMEWLTAGALDKVYVEARGDRLAFVENGVRVDVIDAVGGFGSTLFGHNHPDLVRHQKACLDSAMPVHAQVSHRAHSGRLAAALSKKLSADGQRFISTLVNSGAEAVESAIKHAEMEYATRADGMVREASKCMARALHDLGDIVLGDGLCAALGLRAAATLGQGIRAVEEHNGRVLGERPVFFAVERAFHGKTSGAARLTARSGYHARFSGGIRVERVPADDWRALEARALGLAGELYVLGERQGRIELERHPWTQVAALFLEPVQGEGGVWPLSRTFVEGVRGVADRHAFPIVVDEIQSGFGRCGAFSAAQKLGLRGDYYLFGKALGGGLSKIAALMVDEARYVPDFGLTATSTFSEDDIGVSTALAALDLYDGDGLEIRAGQIGDRLMRALEGVKRRHPSVIRDVRGVGLLIGVELADSDSFASSFLRHMQEELGRLAASWFLNVARIRTLPTASAPRTIRLEPSAYLSQADQDQIVAAFDRFAEIAEKGNLAHLVGHIAGQHLDPARPVQDWRHAPGHVSVPPEPGDARVAFVSYFTEDDDLLDFCPAAAELPHTARNDLIRRLHRLIPPRVVRSARIRSRQGRVVHVEMLGLVATSELVEAAMRAGDLDWIRDRIDEAVDLAAERGATVVGFGGLTSIVTHNARLAATSKIALTTGNSLTVAMGVQGVERACRSAGVDLKSACLAVVGATGNIGTTYAECMAEQVARLILIGRSTSRPQLAALADALYGEAFARLCGSRDESVAGVSAAIAAIEDVRRLVRRGEPVSGAEVRVLVEACLGDDAPIAIADGLVALTRADIVLAASNAARPIIEPEHLRAGPVVVCDVAVPRDVSPRVAELRPDAHVVVGGAVRLPEDADLDFVAGHLPPGHVYACMAETMLLGLEGINGHFSFGRVRREAVRDIAELAAAHGFALGMVEDRSEAVNSAGPRSTHRNDDRAAVN